jgi:hypothetical protein
VSRWEIDLDTEDYEEGDEQTLGLICQAESIRIVSSLQGADIVILCTLQDLGEGSEVDTQWDRPVTTVFGESRSLKLDGDERNV